MLDGTDSVAGKRGLFMYRTASLLMLQRLKGGMSGGVHNFNNIKTQAVINLFFLSFFFFFLQSILTETLWEHAPSYAPFKKWVAQFKHGDFSTRDAPHPGLNST
jgi:hypothetical protein